MRKAFLTSIVLIVLLSSLSAGPFGLEFGTTLQELLDSNIELVNPTREEISEKMEQSGGAYPYDYLPLRIIITPPSPSDLFPLYDVKISEEFGIYEIKAYDGSDTIFEDASSLSWDGNNYAISSYEASYVFERTQNALTLKYGKPESGISQSRWNSEDNIEHMDITLSIDKSKTWKNEEELYEVIRILTGGSSEDDALNKLANEDNYNGLYTVSLTYNQAKYLQALEDSSVL